MKKFINHTLSICWLGLLSVYAPSCKKSENITVSSPKPEKPIENFFGSNVNLDRPAIIHLYGDTVYTVSSSFTREAGEQLIIDEGTIIKVGISTGLPVITIKPGGLIIARGTQQKPIVFTSASAPGTQNVNWGGLVIQGRSFDNSTGTGGVAADSSGSLNYVRIEFSGLVLTGVGKATNIEYIQVSYAQGQPSFEIDGGTFNARHLLSYACGGAADFYITRGYAGKMQNIFAYRHPFFGGATGAPPNALTGMFIENNPYDTTKKPYTSPVISNLTVLGPNAQNGSAPGYSDTISTRSAALITTGNARFRIRNSLLLGFPATGWYLDDYPTSLNIVGLRSECSLSIMQSNDSIRALYLKPGIYPPFNSGDFKNYMLGQPYNNLLFANLNDCKLRDPFNYDAPDPSPQTGSPVLTGAGFSGPDYSDSFFNQVAYKGALGSDSWLTGWTNFTPLKTNYNFPR